MKSKTRLGSSKRSNCLNINWFKVSDAVDMSILLQCLQEERAAVAITIFLNRPSSVDNIQDLQHYVSNGLDITRFTLTQVKHDGFMHEFKGERGGGWWLEVYPPPIKIFVEGYPHVFEGSP